MKFLTDIRLLLISLWLGSAVFFIGVAQTAFAVLPQRELAGAVVNRTLAILNISGIVIAVILLLLSVAGTKTLGKFWVWGERTLFLLIAAACAIGQFVIGVWLSVIRTQLGKPIEEVAVDDPLRIQFNNLHRYSEWVLLVAMGAALIAFFLIANRPRKAPLKSGNDIYNFEKEFKI